MPSEYRLASWALERMGERLGVLVSKALNPLDETDFVTIVSRLASALHGAVKGQEVEALSKALDALDVDWPNLSEAEAVTVYAAAAEAMAGAVTAVSAAEAVLGRSTIVEMTRSAMIVAHDLSIPPEVRGSQALADLLRRSSIGYITDEYGKRAAVLDQQARDIVAQGLERGLGRKDIADELSSGLATYQINRSEHYWQTIASDFATKSRTASQIYSMDEAGIERYQWSAVMDEVTCPICSFLDGKTWSVAAVKQQLDYALQLEDPEDIRNARPFLRHGGEDVFFERNGQRYNVEEGSKQILSDEELEAAGVTVPPGHLLCRCTLVPA